MTAALLLIVIVAGACAGLWILLSRRRSAFALGVVVGTNASAVLHDRLGTPPFILPMALAIIGVAALRTIRAHPLPGDLERSGRRIAGPGDARSWLPVAMFVAIAAVMLSAAVGPFVSVDAASSSAAVGRLLQQLLVLGAAAAAAAHRRGLRSLLWGLVSGGVLLSIVTGLQAVTGATDTTALGFSSWNQEVIGGAGNTLRAAGPFGDDPNAYAQYLVVMTGVALGLAVAKRSSVSRRQRQILLVAAASMAFGVINTASRSGFIGLAVVATGALVVSGLDRRRVAIAAAAGLVVLVSPIGVASRLATLGTSPTAQGADSGLRGRASEMLAAVQMFADHPIVGVGYGTYNDRYLDYSRTFGIDQRFELRSAHSLPLEIAAEQGLIGLAAWATLLALTGIVIVRLHRYRSDLATAYGLGVLGFGTTAVFLHDVFPGLMWMLVGTALGGAVVIDRDTMRTIEGSHRAPLRVAMVIQSYVPAVGGAERQLANLMPGLRARGIEPLVVTRGMAGRPRDDEVDGVPVVRLRVAGPKALRSLMFVTQARAVLARLDPHVVHAFDSMTPSSIALGHRDETGTPFTTKILRSGELGDLHRLVVKPFGTFRLRRLLRNADSLIAISADIEVELESLGVPEDRMARIPNGVDAERFHPADRSARSAADGAPISVVATGRLAPEKRLVDLAERWGRVTERWPGARLVLVGDGPDASRLDGVDGVELLGRRDDVDDLLRDADLYVSASRAEGLSNSLLEAMASGLPCVVTDVGGVRDVIEYPSQGVAVPTGDLDQLVDELIGLIGDRDRRAEMGRAARQRVIDAYALDQTIARLVALYTGLARRPASDATTPVPTGPSRPAPHLEGAPA